MTLDKLTKSFEQIVETREDFPMRIPCSVYGEANLGQVTFCKGHIFFDEVDLDGSIIEGNRYFKSFDGGYTVSRFLKVLKKLELIPSCWISRIHVPTVRPDGTYTEYKNVLVRKDSVLLEGMD